MLSGTFARPAPALGGVCPALRQIQSIGDRQAGRGVGNRQTDRDLAIVLAELTAILPRHSHRMLALFFVNPVSSTIQALTALWRSISGSTHSRTRASSASSDHGDCPTKCRRDSCWVETRVGAVTAASGSTLLRSTGIISPKQ